MLVHIYPLYVQRELHFKYNTSVAGSLLLVVAVESRAGTRTVQSCKAGIIEADTHTRSMRDGRLFSQPHII